MGPVALLLLAIGLVFTVEGLVLALAPSRLDMLLDMIRRMSVEARRSLGLGAIALGVVLIWLAGRL
ncbi:MAG: DUF2065 domain-containing protein [Albidovulum sp.]